MSDITQESRNSLRKMFNEQESGRYLFDAYIDVDLAGDFACAIVKLIGCREAALREELADLRAAFANRVSRVSELLSIMTAAEQRNAHICGLLVRTLPVVRMVGRQDHLCDYSMAGNIQAEIETTLNPRPTESGASE